MQFGTQQLKILRTFLVFAFTIATNQQLAAESPRVLVDGWEVERISAEPELVTPTGCCFDHRGRLLVIECHTHFPPADYQGPKNDRIYIFDDSDQDGSLDRQRVFYDGGVATMNLTTMEEGWIAVASRSQVVRIRDSDGDDVADQVETLITLETSASYPHNGLGGLTYGSDGWLYVGQGENFGEPYTLVASDGTTQIGSGEGGNVFRCRADGSRLERIATGFWNPFGLCLDSAMRLWSVGNDPDARPPCRLMHVVEAGDYGFQFRFGRAGTHPLQAWNGELPGTLPMTAGTGEATCAILQHGEYLWVTSWGDNRIERYKIEPSGASWTSRTETIVQGDAQFRPVGITAAPDGSIYFTDWVDRSYAVHGKGRLWRLKPTTSQTVSATGFPQLSEAELRAADLRENPNLSRQDRLAALEQTDPFIRQAAVAGLVRTRQLKTLRLQELGSAAERLGLLLSWRWQELIDPAAISQEARTELLLTGLTDPDRDVVLTAIRWATERSCKSLLPEIQQVLNRQDLTPQLFSATIASIAYLESGSANPGRRDPAIEKRLIDIALDADRQTNLRALALKQLPPAAEQPTSERLAAILQAEHDRGVAIEVVGLLNARQSDDAQQQLANLAANESLDLQTRADALACLSRNASRFARLIRNLSLPKQPDVLRVEARRIISGADAVRTGNHPQVDDIEAWTNLVDAGNLEGVGGNVDAGRRVFLRTTCVNCHAHSGRGAHTGPDLTTIAGQMTSSRLIESILLPSREIGPLYVPWQVLTVDGQVLTGLKLDGSGAGEEMRFQGADGDVFTVKMEDIEQQTPITQSIMPTGLQNTMSLEEFKDLIAFLLHP